MADEPMVKITIDGRDLEVPKGTLLIRAAESIGTTIPRFCDHRLLKPVGACRQCIVEVEGQRKPMTSCTTQASDGMVVRTQFTSEVSRRAQETNLEFLLINHPLDCPMCDKGGECPLQDQTLANGPGETRFTEVKRRYEKPIKISETVLLDRERCVLCARCTRFSDEIAGDPFIDLFDRGVWQQVNISPDEPFHSYFSGNTVQICPVGALTSPSYRFQARPFDLSSSNGICNGCAAGCNLRIDSRRDIVQRQLARDNDEVNEAWVCDKGRYAFAYAQSPTRVLTPMIRERGELRTASWSEALRRAADGIRAAGGGSGVLIGGHLTDQDTYALGKLARVALRTNNVDARNWAPGPGEQAVDEHVAAAPVDVTYTDLERAAAVVAVDLDPHEEAGILYLRLRKAALERGVPVIAVGPRPGRLTEFGTALRTAPGLEADALDWLARRDGDAAKLLPEPGGDASVIVLAGWRAARTGALAAAARFARTVGGRFAWVPRRAGDRGALDVGARPYLLPGGRRVADPDARAELAAAWGIDPPAEPGLDAHGMLEQASAGQLGTLVLAGVDLTGEHGPRELAEQALANAFVVAIDHEVTDTTRHADVLFPAATHAEVEGTYTDWEGRVQQHHSAVRVAGAAQTVWELADQLAVALKVDLGLPAYRYVAEETARLRARPATWQPLPLPEPPATPEPTGPEDGLNLVTYPLLLDGGSLIKGARDLERATVDAFAELHPDDAARLGVGDGTRLELDFGDGRTASVPARVAATTAPGCVFVPANQPDLPLSALLGPDTLLRVAVRSAEEAAA